MIPVAPGIGNLTLLPSGIAIYVSPFNG
ncbi:MULTISPECIES: hypothetical protein [unclassified Catenibacterium]